VGRPRCADSVRRGRRLRVAPHWQGFSLVGAPGRRFRRTSSNRGRGMSLARALSAGNWLALYCAVHTSGLLSRRLAMDRGITASIDRPMRDGGSFLLLRASA